MRCIPVVVLGLLCLIAEPPSSGYASEPALTKGTPWSLRDGDRVALVGDTFIEREQRAGYVETALTLANPDKTILFRNLGWSGDTVSGLSRAGFDPPEAGFKQLIDQVNAVKPTVIVIGYGGNESFEGQAGLDRFSKGLIRLIDTLRPTQARFVLLAPLKHENLGQPLPDPTKHNKDVALYTDAIQDVARKAGAVFLKLDPFAGRESTPGNTPLTDNGIHLTEFGFWTLAKSFVPQDQDRWQFSSTASGVLGSSGKVQLTLAGASKTPGHVSQVEMTSEAIRFTFANGSLPFPPKPGSKTGEDYNSIAAPIVTVTGLAPGRYQLTIDGKPVATATEQEWSKGIARAYGPDFERSEQLRQTIVKKNELFFHRWRPQNITYLFGFRKHEQGNNAIEIPQFDPLVAEQEQKIADLRKPVSHVYELVREAEVKGAAR